MGEQDKGRQVFWSYNMLTGEDEVDCVGVQLADWAGFETAHPGKDVALYEGLCDCVVSD